MKRRIFLRKWCEKRGLCGPYRTGCGVLLYGGCNVGLHRNLFCPYRTFGRVIWMRACVNPYGVEVVYAVPTGPHEGCCCT